MKAKLLKISTICLCSILLLCGCGSDDGTSNNTATGTSSNSSSSTNSSTKTTDLKTDANASGEITKEGKLVVFATNNNDTPVDMEIEVEFYDEDGLILGSDKETLLGVGSNAEVAVEMYSTPDEFSTYEIYVDIEKTEISSYVDELEIVHNDNGEEIVVQIKNTTDDTIEGMTVAVVYYDNDEVVGYSSDYEFDVSSGRSGNFTVSYPYDDNYKEVEFDTYKVYLIEAYTYD